MIGAGMVNPDETVAWREGLDDWVPVRSFLVSSGTVAEG